MHGDFCPHDIIMLCMMVLGPVTYCARCLKALVMGHSSEHEGAQPSEDELGGEGGH